MDSTKLYTADLLLKPYSCHIRSSINKGVVFSNNAGSKYKAERKQMGKKTQDSETRLVNTESISHIMTLLDFL